MDENIDLGRDLVQSIRLGLQSEADGMRLFAAKLVRKYRVSAPEVADRIDEYLRAAPASSPMRRSSSRRDVGDTPHGEGAATEELALLRPDTNDARAPILGTSVSASLEQLLAERRQRDNMRRHGLEPIRSSIFVGPPGVGKTMTARWVAHELDMPLLVLDLSAVMSSFLGGTGTNLKAVFEHAKSSPCILFLDEIDAIAKRRGDPSDVGELKRLVTVMLQQIDTWPSTSLLLAATNHPELIDPAFWRRFDQTIEFPHPERRQVTETIERVLGESLPDFGKWLTILSIVFDGNAFGDIERTLRQFRKATTLRTATPTQLVERLLHDRSVSADRADRHELAKALVANTTLSQHKIHDITGVSRDTLRKFARMGDVNGD